jgi:hypothetical protein
MIIERRKRRGFRRKEDEEISLELTRLHLVADRDYHDEMKLVWPQRLEDDYYMKPRAPRRRI